MKVLVLEIYLYASLSIIKCREWYPKTSKVFFVIYMQYALILNSNVRCGLILKFLPFFENKISKLAQEIVKLKNVFDVRFFITFFSKLWVISI